jgi:LysM repeat protein
MNKTVVIFFFSMVCFFQAPAQTITAQQYIEQYKDIAISEMKRMGVPAAITLAQGLLESQSGNSDLVKESNNHFGIKCKSNWTSEWVKHDDDEPGECFRKYKTAADSFRDHSDFLRGSSRYAFLFTLDPSNFKAWAQGLQKAGYATNPRYPEILIKNIEKYNLEQYTLQAEDYIASSESTEYLHPTENNSSTVINADSNFSEPISLSVNGSKALLVPKGTSLLAIATQHHINLDKLLSINDLTKDGLLDKNQYIFLEKKQKQGKDNFYVSLPNESMYEIAQKNGVVLQNLYDYNNLTPEGFIVAGTKIFLKPGNADGSKLSAQSSK